MVRASLLAAAVGLSLAAGAPVASAADVKAECIAAADQGQSLRDDGKYTRAREAFTRCARDTCPKVVAQSCNRWLNETNEATPTVVPGAKDAAGQDLTDAAVTVDGNPLGGSLDGKPVPVDPGPHVFRFTRAGSDDAEASVVLRAGEKNRVVSVTLRPSAAAVGESSPAVRERGASFFSTRNVTALSMLVVGAAAIGVGADFLGQSGSKSSTASTLRSAMPSDACTVAPTSAPCQQLGSAVDAQHTDAAVGAAMLLGGGVLVAASVVAWVIWPKTAPPATGVGVVTPVLEPRAGGASLGIEGKF